MACPGSTDMPAASALTALTAVPRPPAVPHRPVTLSAPLPAPNKQPSTSWALWEGGESVHCPEPDTSSHPASAREVPLNAARLHPLSSGEGRHQGDLREECSRSNDMPPPGAEPWL